MIEHKNRSIPSTLEELVQPRETAVIVVDIQNDFCTKGGKYSKHGKQLCRGAEMIDKTERLLKEARNVGVLIIYTENTTLPDHIGDSAARIRYLMNEHAVADPNFLPEHTLEGTWGQQIVDRIAPHSKDLVVKKNRPSAFIGTNLDMLLRSNSIKTVIITGVVTEGCVDSTARDASFHEYFVVLPRDCIDSTSQALHEASLKMLGQRFDLANSEEIIGIWKQQSHDNTKPES